ncbi:MAG TPA: M4 family metallopeptidase [Thermoanaerobaculia bacterium]
MSVRKNTCICTVIPPHILRHVADGGDYQSRITARATLVEIRSIAGKRQRTLIVPPADAAPAGKQRSVYDAKHTRTLPGKLVMSEASERGTDPEVNEAFDGSGTVFDFYQNVFDRISIDGKAMPIDATVHYGRRFDNAMWNGEQMVYGDGDGTLFNRFTKPLEVIGHELTHGVTQFTAALGYTGQTGALNEHISDAFGIMIKQWALGQSAKESDWLIGEGLLAPGVKGKAIRSMAAPGTAYDDPRLGRDPQPAHMRDYVRTSADGGGVHVNSGILNRAFYLAAIAIGGETWPVLGRVWYETLTKHLGANAQFRDFAQATVTVAGQLAGIGSDVQRAIAKAWSDVGLTVRLRSIAASKWRRRPPSRPSSRASYPARKNEKKGVAK